MLTKLTAIRKIEKLKKNIQNEILGENREWLINIYNRKVNTEKRIIELYGDDEEDGTVYNLRFKAYGHDVSLLNSPSLYSIYSKMVARIEYGFIREAGVSFRELTEKQKIDCFEVYGIKKK